MINVNFSIYMYVHYYNYNFLYSGITKQCGNIPTHFIVELLNKQQRIVLTGKGIDSI